MGDLFLSHSSKDKPVALGIAEALKAAGHRVFVDSDHVDGIAPSSDWRATLFRELRLAHAVVFLNSVNSQGSMWCHTELSLAVERIPIYAVDLEAGVKPHSLLGSVQSIRLETDVAASTKWLIDSLAQLFGAGNQQFHLPRGRVPYPGLRSFEAADAAAFFGRSQEVDALLERIDPLITTADSDVVTVIGPSGSGKSSLLKAGVLPRLARRAGWLVVGPFEPGPTPTDALVAALVHAAGTDLGSGFDRVQLRKEGLAAVVARLVDADPERRRVVVAIDQYEYLQSTPAAERSAFLALLADSLNGQSRITLLLTARQDRLDDITAFPRMGPFVARPFLVRPIGRDGLAEAIEAPAALVDMSIGPGLTAALVEDAAQGSGENVGSSLPLLACTLHEIYELAVAGGEREMTLAHYESVGKVAGAIRATAQRADDRLADADGATLDSLLVDLVSVDDGRAPVARPVAPATLSPEKQALLARLMDERLVTGDAHSARLVHDGLIANWPRLAEVVKREGEHLLARSRLERRAIDWTKDPTEDRLLGPDGAEEAMKVLDAYAPEPVARFVRASQHRNQRRRRRTQGVLAVITALAVVASVLAVVSTQRNADLRARSEVERSQRLAALSAKEPDAESAALLALEAVRASPTPAAHAQLGIAYQRLTETGWRLGRMGDVEIDALALAPDGSMLASGAAAGDRDQIRIWDLETKALRRNITGDDADGPIVWSRDSAMVARSFIDGGVGLWDVGTGALLRTLGTDDRIVGGLSSRGSLATVSSRGVVSVWDIDAMRTGLATVTALTVPTGFVPATSEDGEPAPFPFTWSPDGRRFATASAQVGWIVYRDAATGASVGTAKAGSTPITFLAWSAETDRVAVGLDTSFSAGIGAAAAVFLRRQAGTWSADGTRFMTSGPDLPTQVYRPNTDGATVYTTQEPPTGICSLPAVPSPRTTGGRPAWCIPIELGLPPGGAGESSLGGTWSPDASMLAISSRDRIVIKDSSLVTLLELDADLIGASERRTLVWSPDGRHVAASLAPGAPPRPDASGFLSASDSFDVQVWDVSGIRSLSARRPIRERQKSVAAVFSPDGSAVATGDAGVVRLHRTTGGPDLAQLLPIRFADATAPPVGEPLAAAWAAAAELRLPDGEPTFSPDGERLAVRGPRSFTVTDVATRRVVATVVDPAEFDIGAMLDDRGRLIRSGSGWTIIDVATGKATMRVAEGLALRDDAGISPDGRYLAGVVEDGAVVVYDLSGRRPAPVEVSATLRAADRLSKLRWSPDPSRPVLAAIDDSGRLVLWDPAAPKQIRRLSGAAPILSVAWGSDGWSLYTFASNATYQVWDRRTPGAPPREATLPRWLATSLSAETTTVWPTWSPDGRTLAAMAGFNVATRRGTVVLVPCFICLPLAELEGLVRARVPRPLTSEEREVAGLRPDPDTTACRARPPYDESFVALKGTTFTDSQGDTYRIEPDCSLSEPLSSSPSQTGMSGFDTIPIVPPPPATTTPPSVAPNPG